ncbi:MAG: type II toxin-antitoxin system RelE/ParE family toxin [bacterium]|nr:type II toxin-antitoxin system RelE/ParE family toxin [bacterium]
MSIIISPRAEKQLRKLPKFDQIAVIEKIRSLSTAATQKEEKLSGYKDIFRVRVGDYRIVYRKASQSVYIVLIRHRRDVYRVLKNVLG